MGERTLGTPKGLEAIFNSKIRVPLGIGVGVSG